MKNLFITTAIALGLMASAASAFQLNDRAAWNTDITGTWDVEAEDFSVVLDTEFTYAFNQEVSAYMSTSFDLSEDTEFTGVDVGVSYNPAAAQNLSVGAWVELDSEFEYTNAFLEVTFSF